MAELENLSVTGVYDLDDLPSEPVDRFYQTDRMVVSRLDYTNPENYTTYKFGISALDGHIENHVYNRLQSNYICANTVDIYHDLRCHNESHFNKIDVKNLIIDGQPFSEWFRELVLCTDVLSDYVRKSDMPKYLSAYVTAGSLDSRLTGYAKLAANNVFTGTNTMKGNLKGAVDGKPAAVATSTIMMTDAAGKTYNLSYSQFAAIVNDLVDAKITGQNLIKWS